jgi:hypothetical protein
MSKIILHKRGEDSILDSHGITSDPSVLKLTTDRSIPGAPNNFKLRLINQSSGMGFDQNNRNNVRKQAQTVMNSPRIPDSEYDDSERLE